MLVRFGRVNVNQNCMICTKTHSIHPQTTWNLLTVAQHVGSTAARDDLFGRRNKTSKSPNLELQNGLIKAKHQLKE